MRRRLLLVVTLAVVAAAAALVIRSGGDDGRLLPSSVPDPPQDPLPGGGRSFYVDAEDGSDEASGTSTKEAWKSLARAASAPLQPGDRLLFRRNRAWSGTLTLTRSGTEERQIVVGAYGEGSPPRLTAGTGQEARVDGRNRQGSGSGSCVRLEGSYVRIRALELSDCRPARAGLQIRGDNNVVEAMTIADNEAGIVVARGGDANRIIGNLLRDNDLMTTDSCDDPPKSVGDYGAYSIAIEGGSGTEVAYNYASGALADSCDYGIDGSMVEIFSARDTNVHHNVSQDNATFAEVGGGGSETHRFAYNQVIATRDAVTGFVIHGGGSFGGARDVQLVHNSVRLRGARTLAVGCFGYCGPEVLRARNNIFAAAKAAEAPQPYDDDHNLYSGALQLTLGPRSMRADPGFAEGPGVNLTARSPAVDAATAEAEAGAGQSVSDGKPDLGALEFRPVAT